MMFQVVIVFAIAFVLQAVLSGLQMKHFSDEFVKLRRQGKVVIGRKAGGFHAGAIVMFLIDDKGIIRTGRKLEGVTFLARVRDFTGYEGRYVGDLTEEDGPRNHRNLRKAMADAALTYRKFVNGEEIPDPPSPFRQVGNAAMGLIRSFKAA